MSIICKLFGHTPKSHTYGVKYGVETDGLGIEHVYAKWPCIRCGESVCLNLHTPIRENEKRQKHLLEVAGNLLAVIHRDGGHHTHREGFEQSCKDAEKVVLAERQPQYVESKERGRKLTEHELAQFLPAQVLDIISEAGDTPITRDQVLRTLIRQVVLLMFDKDRFYHEQPEGDGSYRTGLFINGYVRDVWGYLHDAVDLIMNTPLIPSDKDPEVWMSWLESVPVMYEALKKEASKV